MSLPGDKKAVYDDLHRLPENVTGEIIDGELYTSPRPHYRHSAIEFTLSGELGPPYCFGRGGGPGGWVILIEPEIMLGDHLLVPDLAGWKKERLPKLPKTNWTTVSPDWVCEILSPNTRSVDRIKKMPIYARHEVRHAWLLDPLDRTLEVYQLENGRWVVLGYYSQKDKVQAEPFLATEIDLGLLWMEEE